MVVVAVRLMMALMAAPIKNGDVDSADRAFEIKHDGVDFMDLS